MRHEVFLDLLVDIFSRLHDGYHSNLRRQEVTRATAVLDYWIPKRGRP
jgi:hypothetical protein